VYAWNRPAIVRSSIAGVGALAARVPGTGPGWLDSVRTFQSSASHASEKWFVRQVWDGVTVGLPVRHTTQTAISAASPP
jgi:hypothetical protein